MFFVARSSFQNQHFIDQIECQTVWTKTWVQTVCKGYQQTTPNRDSESYMSADVLLNLFNELRKSDKMVSLSNILSLFRNEFNKSNDTGARILVSIYHMTLRLL